MSDRRLGIVSRISLTGQAEGWDDCFVLSSPVTYSELKMFKAMKTQNLTDEQGVDLMLDFIRKHIIGGTVKLLEGSKLINGDLLPDDVDAMSSTMINHIFKEMTGVGAQYLDPKVSTSVTPPTSGTSSESAPLDTPTTNS
jgi:hypothetical protein